MIRDKKIKLKQWQNIYHVIVNANSIIKHIIQIKKGIIRHVNVCECKNYHKFKTDYSWNPNKCIYENNKYLKKNC